MLLVGATVIAFFTGGYFPEAQAWAGLIGWVLVLAAALCGPRRPAPDLAGWLALGGLALFGGWTLLSIIWAPVAGTAYHEGQLVMAYAGVLVAAWLLLRGRAVARAVEPALAGGVLVVIGYGIAGRLLPGLLHYARSASAQGRLEQPLTYWNAMGELAALGFVLSVRVAGDAERPRLLRGVAAASCVPLLLGLYLSFSRGALFACAAGVVALIVAVRRREQLEAVLLAVAAGAAASAATAPLGGVTSLAGTLATRERQGAIALAVIAFLAALAAAVQFRLARRRPATLGLPRHAAGIATVLICAGLALAIVVGSKEANGPLSGGASRYATLQSNRYAYWDVALKAFAHQPLRGVGAGGWAVWWLRYRTIDDFAQHAHSLALQTLAELGLVGIALLGSFFGGVALTARAAQRASPTLSAGALAVFVTYAAHAPLDWDWQMPAVTLIAVIAAGLLLATSAEADRSWVREGHTRPERRARPAATAAPRSAVPRG